MKILMTEDFTATLQDNQKDFLKLMFDGALSAAHSAAAQYRVYRDEFDYQNLGGFESNPLLDDLTEMYSNIMNTAAER